MILSPNHLPGSELAKDSFSLSLPWFLHTDAKITLWRKLRAPRPKFPPLDGFFFAPPAIFRSLPGLRASLTPIVAAPGDVLRTLEQPPSRSFFLHTRPPEVKRLASMSPLTALLQD